MVQFVASDLEGGMALCRTYLSDGKWQSTPSGSVCTMNTVLPAELRDLRERVFSATPMILMMLDVI